MALTSDVALDTNMLLSIQQLKIDVFWEIEQRLGKTRFFLTKQVKDELDLVEKRGEKEALQVTIAKKAMEKNSVEVIIVEAENADDSLLKLAKKGVFIATNDKELRKRIKTIRGKSIYLKKKKLIEIE